MKNHENSSSNSGNGDNAAANAWAALGGAPKSDKKSIDKEQAGKIVNEKEYALREPERLLERAALYRKFGKVALVLEAIEKARGDQSAADFLRKGLDLKNEGEPAAAAEQDPAAKEVKENVGVQSAEKFNEKEPKSEKLDAEEKNAAEFTSKADTKTEKAEKEKSPEEVKAADLFNQLRMALGALDKS